MVYNAPFFRGQNGVAGRILGGWSISPLFTAQSGVSIEVNIGSGSNTDAQSFGEVYGNRNAAYENAPLLSTFTGGNSHYNVTVASGCGLPHVEPRRDCLQGHSHPGADRGYARISSSQTC